MMTKMYNAVKTITIVDVLLIISILGITKFYNDENGIYQVKVLGAVYEILWLPLIATLFALLVAWIFMAVKKKTLWSNIIFPLLVLIGLIGYLLLGF